MVRATFLFWVPFICSYQFSCFFGSAWSFQRHGSGPSTMLGKHLLEWQSTVRFCYRRTGGRILCGSWVGPKDSSLHMPCSTCFSNLCGCKIILTHFSPQSGSLPHKGATCGGEGAFSTLPLGLLPTSLEWMFLIWWLAKLQDMWSWSTLV